MPDQPIDLACHDEIVFVQALDLLGAQRNRCVTPAKVDIGVMALTLGQFADLMNEGESLTEIAEAKRPLDAARLLVEAPIGGPRLEALSFNRRQGWNAPATGGAGLLGKGGFGH